MKNQINDYNELKFALVINCLKLLLEFVKYLFRFLKFKVS